MKSQGGNRQKRFNYFSDQGNNSVERMNMVVSPTPGGLSPNGFKQENDFDQSCFLLDSSREKVQE